MFHPGKIITVLNNKKDEVSPDREVQAVLIMWDENMITLPVHPKLGQKIQEGDIAIVDYRPTEKLGVPVPRQVIVKLLRGKKGLALWDRYAEYHEKRKRSANRLPTAPAGGYIG